MLTSTTPCHVVVSHEVVHSHSVANFFLCGFRNKGSTCGAVSRDIRAGQNCRREEGASTSPLSLPTATVSQCSDELALGKSARRQPKWRRLTRKSNLDARKTRTRATKRWSGLCFSGSIGGTATQHISGIHRQQKQPQEETRKGKMAEMVHQHGRRRLSGSATPFRESSVSLPFVGATMRGTPWFSERQTAGCESLRGGWGCLFFQMMDLVQSHPGRLSPGVWRGIVCGGVAIVACLALVGCRAHCRL